MDEISFGPFAGFNGSLVVGLRKEVNRVKVKKKDWRQISCGLMILSFFSVLAAAWGFVYSDIVLASTQWLLIAAVLAGFGIYTRMGG